MIISQFMHLHLLHLVMGGHERATLAHAERLRQLLVASGHERVMHVPDAEWHQLLDQAISD